MELRVVHVMAHEIVWNCRSRIKQADVLSRQMQVAGPDIGVQTNTKLQQVNEEEPGSSVGTWFKCVPKSKSYEGSRRLLKIILFRRSFHHDNSLTLKFTGCPIYWAKICRRERGWVVLHLLSRGWFWSHLIQHMRYWQTWKEWIEASVRIWRVHLYMLYTNISFGHFYQIFRQGDTGLYKSVIVHMSNYWTI